MSKNISDLRNLLFQTIEGVKAGTIDVERAKVIGDLSQVVVNTAKAEVDYARHTGAVGSGFLEMDKVAAPEGALPQGITGIRRYGPRG
jgi:hypothetical protein